MVRLPLDARQFNQTAAEFENRALPEKNATGREISSASEFQYSIGR
jgi:hypothetical protein